MKKLLLLALVLASCSKEEIIQPKEEYKPNKDYSLSSYELQQSDVKIDLMQLRSRYGTNNPWNILAVTYLDINGDGNDDIFMNSSYGLNERTNGEIYIYKNGDYVKDNSYFQTTPPSLIHPRKAITGDFNNDKMPDIFITGHGYDQAPFTGEYTELLLSNANKKYDLVKFENIIGFFHGTSSADIDNDKDLDIFVMGKFNSYFLINDGKGNFTYNTTKINNNELSGQYTCELLDVNKDGYFDIVMGGHEFDYNNNTKIYWGDNTATFTTYTIIPRVTSYGVVTDIDMYDLDGNNTNELVITRSGGHDQYIHFYNGWYIQVVKINNEVPTDVTNDYIENNSIDYNNPNPWIIWVRFQDYDKNGKVDLFSTICGQQGFVRWELQNKKLVRI